MTEGSDLTGGVVWASFPDADATGSVETTGVTCRGRCKASMALFKSSGNMHASRLASIARIKSISCSGGSSDK